MQKVNHILIMGASGDYNLGDELIVESEIRYFQERFPDARIQVCVYDHESQVDRPDSIETLHYFPYHIRRHPLRNIGYFFQNLIALIRTDILVVGGGGIFFDNESGISFRKIVWQWCLRIAFARLWGARVIFFGISLEIQREKNLKYLTKLFHKDDIVLPRDERSAHLLAQIDISSTPISDIVFLSQKVRQPKTPITIRRVGISLRSGFTRDDTLLQAIIEFLHTRGYQLVFLAHSLHHHPSRDDRKVLDELDKTLHIEVTHTLKETLDAYAHLDVVVGMRFHSIVLAALHALPTIILSYGPKTLSLAEELHLTEVTLRAQEIDIEDFAKKWHYLEQNSTDLSRSISSRATTIQKKLLQQLQSHDILPL